MSTGSSMADRFIADTLAPSFAESYYGHLAQEDAESYNDVDLDQRVETHLRLGFERHSDQALVFARNDDGKTVVYVVTDDMPFLVDSVVAEIVRQQHAISLVTHPTFIVQRDQATGRLTNVDPISTVAPISSGDTATLPSMAQFLQNADSDTKIESWIAVQLAAEKTEEECDELVAGLEAALADVRVSVDDWQLMRNKVQEIVSDLEAKRATLDVDGLEEAAELLRWLDNGHFTFLGYREYDLIESEGEDALEIQIDSSLGLMRRNTPESVVQQLNSFGRAHAREKKPLVITKANRRSRVDRSVYLDYIGVKSFDEQGNVTGERRFIGLFASSAYIRSVRDIPVVRKKVDAVRHRAGFAAESHSGKDLIANLEAYPRDELFQIEVDDLYETVMGILKLQERRVTRVFLRPDTYGRFMSALVFVPRDRYTTNVRRRIESELKDTFESESLDFEVHMSESALVRVFFRIRLPKGGEVPRVDRMQLEKRLVRAVRSWPEGVSQVLGERHPDTARELIHQWAEAFPAAYRVAFEVEDALKDIAEFTLLESPGHQGPVVRISPATAEEESNGLTARLKIYVDATMSLSRILPVLTNQGLEVIDETPYTVRRGDNSELYLYVFGLRFPTGGDALEVYDLLGEAYRAVALGRAETDVFDRLILAQGMTWRKVSVLRAYAKYLRQLGNSNSYEFMGDTLLANPDVSKALIDVFEATFRPDLADGEREAAVDKAREELSNGLEQVATLDADRLLRRFQNVIAATLRTNFYAQDAEALTFKLSPGDIDGAPYPRPKYEIWVYSPLVEGVHLRFGAVARGGLRWSDRREDFRTEVLGLVKAQVTKNAVIVPDGAKGGFFAKQLPDPAVDRGAWFEAGKSAYRIFIRSLLSVTDNLDIAPDGTQTVIPPEDVVRLDGDDTYLVVAADKGTATFSDVANEISLDMGHWLGDAFASGGSVGYDHKAMGITARGAWESVKSHFKELDHDTQAEDFTVAGVGDMSGDVFGNGMLLSRHIRLVAAFDHRHIFLDPAPVAATSFEERERLFELPRSSWADYDKDLISEGGGIYPRHSKTIPITPQVREALGIEGHVTKLTPPELLRAILRAPVDLFYNGGIGTYIKSSSESHTDVGDRANDQIRVDGREVRARVIGEGGNLGLTQLGRVEAALNGVLLNTDAIDNSAGVDCSDHEVNIKILVDRLVAGGKLGVDDRASFLESMTSEVASLVLKTNFDQNVLLVNDRQKMSAWSASFERLMDWLEQYAGLDRELEFLPSAADLKKRRANGQGLTSPELSVLAAYAKLQLTSALTDARLADDPYFNETLVEYFPSQLRERFRDDILAHPLRQEIVAMCVANDIVNTGGITYAFRVIEETGASELSVAQAFVALQEIYEFDRIFSDVHNLPVSFSTEQWSEFQLDTRRMLDRTTRWFIAHVGDADVQAAIDMFRPTVQRLCGRMQALLQAGDSERVAERYDAARGWDIGAGLAKRWSEQFETFPLLDIAQAVNDDDFDADELAAVYYTVYERFDIDTLLERITNLPREDRWQSLARAGLRDDVYTTALDIARSAMTITPEGTPEEKLDAWEAEQQQSLERVKHVFDEVNSQERDDMASLSVALRLLRSIVRR
ncbi:NAD-glutamate dehydrogenase [Zhihengliuella salsuginis]|uniref:NAD-glutamate dehydrogenase n=1 Tax=Zhihengliuella salsuginis TaxID=578222 RepID=A0ABQ3GBN3_9MICC|nr:NAD-glutamate dehydrogenase [Zhihengliuella salsuginis]GHD00898.1 NAD-glutamate dehydrogenase [Zhihengliuella salsuginis]